MTIYIGFSHEKLWFSIAMLVYQRVYFPLNTLYCWTAEPHGLLVTFVPNLALRVFDKLRHCWYFFGHCPVGVADGSMNEKTRKKHVSFPITVTHSSHVCLPKVPRYPKISQGLLPISGFSASRPPPFRVRKPRLWHWCGSSGCHGWWWASSTWHGRLESGDNQWAPGGDFSWDIWTIVNRCSWVYGIPWYLWDIR